MYIDSVIASKYDVCIDVMQFQIQLVEHNFGQRFISDKMEIFLQATYVLYIKGQIFYNIRGQVLDIF